MMISAMDIADERVSIVTVKLTPRGLRIAGAGEAPLAGFKDGLLTNVGDAAESVREAAQQAGRSAGTVLQSIYYNYRDLSAQSMFLDGATYLKGDGEVQVKDVREACRTAKRMGGNLYRTILYAEPISFTVDDKDEVTQPVGIFAKKLSVNLHAVEVDAAELDRWKQVMERSGFVKAVPVLAAQSAAQGLFDENQRVTNRLTAYLDGDTGVLFAYGSRVIQKLKPLRTGSDAAVVAAVKEALGDFKRGIPTFMEFYVSGSLFPNERLMQELTECVGVTARLAAPQGVARFDQPKDAALVGLISVAEELEKKAKTLRPRKGLLAAAHSKAKSFLNDYF